MIRALRLAAALCALTVGGAQAQSPLVFTNRTGTGPAQPGDPIRLGEMTGNGTRKVDTVNGAFGTPNNSTVVRLGDTFPMNPNGTMGLASQYFGSRGVPSVGHMHGTDAHLYLEGETRGWDEGTCVVSIMANAGLSAPGCSQGGYGDMGYRTVYPGQDSTGLVVSAQGITPTVLAAPVAGFGSTTITNLAGQPQTVATLTLATPLSASQIAAINKPGGPKRVQINNGFFGYTIPQGVTAGGALALPASADGTTLLVDNWTRADVSNGGALRDIGMGPTLPYVTTIANTLTAGTGVYPNQVGMTNGSAPLLAYTVTVDFVFGIGAYGAVLRTDDNDQMKFERVIEFGLLNNRTGPHTWNELQPLSDQQDGGLFDTNLFYGGCFQDSGAGTGTCSSFINGTNGLKRVVVCGNGDGPDLSGTDCILDTATTFGYKSVKASGYVLWVDPGNTGNTKFVMDAFGNISTKGQMLFGSGAARALITPDGAVSTGLYTVATLPPCNGGSEGKHLSVTDAASPAYLIALTGGGSVHAPAYCNGAAWVAD